MDMWHESVWKVSVVWVSRSMRESWQLVIPACNLSLGWWWIFGLGFQCFYISVIRLQIVVYIPRHWHFIVSQSQTLSVLFHRGNPGGDRGDMTPPSVKTQLIIFEQCSSIYWKHNVSGAHYNCAIMCYLNLKRFSPPLPFLVVVYPTLFPTGGAAWQQ